MKVIVLAMHPQPQTDAHEDGADHFLLKRREDELLKSTIRYLGSESECTNAEDVHGVSGP